MESFKKNQKNEYDQSIGVHVGATPLLHDVADELQGHSVKLRELVGVELKKSDADQLWQCVNAEPDQRCWTYLPYAAFSRPHQLEETLSVNFNFAGSVHYLIEVKHQLLGWVALLNPRPEHRAIEIGNVYFSSQMKQSTAATETIYLLLKSCFEQGYRRVEWKCDELNTPSYRAALRYGFSYEGTFRQDRIAKGRNRNTAWFSILDEEWPALKLAFMAWLSTDNFDEQGQQKIRLNDFMALYQRA